MLAKKSKGAGPKELLLLLFWCHWICCKGRLTKYYHTPTAVGVWCVYSIIACVWGLHTHVGSCGSHKFGPCCCRFWMGCSSAWRGGPIAGKCMCYLMC